MKVKNYLINLIFCLCFFAAMIMGYSLDKTGNVRFGNWWGWLLVLLLGIIASPIVTFLITKLDLGLAGREKKISKVLPFSFKYFIIRLIGLIVCYIPVWLAVWPGFFCYDAETEAYMVMTYKFSQHHPLIHELLLGETLRLGNRIFGSFNGGIALYLGVQLIVVALCFSYILTTFRRMNVPKAVCNIGWAFLALFPTVAMFALCSSKDVLFTVGVVTLSVISLEISKGIYEKNMYVIFSIGTLLLLFFRKNGLYAYPFFLLFLLVWVIKEKDVKLRKFLKNMIILGILLTIFFILTSGILAAALHAEKDEEREKLCVPMQQLARVYTEKPEVWSEDEKEILFSLFPEVILQRYNPKLADDIKFNFLEDNYKSDKKKYNKFWWDTFKKCPDIYVNSFLANTYGYWYPNTVLSGYEGYKIVDRYYGESCYFEFVTEMPGVRQSFIPWLERFYEMISLEVSFQKIPIVSWLFSIGFWMWAYAFLILYLIQSKAKDSKKMLLAFVIPFILLLINLLGPIALVRYVLFYFFGIPIFLSSWFICNKKYETES